MMNAARVEWENGLDQGGGAGGGTAPYYARDWFLWKLYRLRSLAAMAAKHGYSNQVFNNWETRHDLALRPGLRPKLTLQLATATTIRGSGALASAMCELLENGSRTAPDSVRQALEGVQP
ncbi:hypothetical protein [Deinococcus arenicola]|uniref:XRE family transcriptional regulator n=1 Tax=Deinococcus arenicola TaxID=2994950 RepID=A0ABU4DQU3_9DEIO|nr:hypothetical protein [Deinococcus sp. ZS9-10]MDV6374807.1 hypothetical protein [Deinococcus sp. ZS9-10]